MIGCRARVFFFLLWGRIFPLVFPCCDRQLFFYINYSEQNKFSTIPKLKGNTQEQTRTKCMNWTVQNKATAFNTGMNGYCTFKTYRHNFLLFLCRWRVFLSFFFGTSFLLGASFYNCLLGFILRFRLTGVNIWQIKCQHSVIFHFVMHFLISYKYHKISFSFSSA